MDKQEATELLRATLAGYRGLSYQTLSVRVGTDEEKHVTGASGTEYQIEVQFFWDGSTGGPVRVMCSIDDGGWRAFVPLCESFVLAPDGSFVGEGAA